MRCLSIWILLVLSITKNECQSPKSKKRVLLPPRIFYSLPAFELEYNLEMYNMSNYIINNIDSTAKNINGYIESKNLILTGSIPQNVRVDIGDRKFAIKLYLTELVVINGSTLALKHTFKDKEPKNTTWYQSHFNNELSAIKGEKNITITKDSLTIHNFQQHNEQRYCIKVKFDFTCWDVIQLRTIHFYSENEIELDIPIRVKDSSKIELINAINNSHVDDNIMVRLEEEKIYIYQNNRQPGSYELKIYETIIAHIHYVPLDEVPLYEENFNYTLNIPNYINIYHAKIYNKSDNQEVTENPKIYINAEANEIHVEFQNFSCDLAHDFLIKLDTEGYYNYTLRPVFYRDTITREIYRGDDIQMETEFCSPVLSENILKIEENLFKMVKPQNTFSSINSKHDNQFIQIHFKRSKCESVSNFTSSCKFGINYYEGGRCSDCLGCKHDKDIPETINFARASSQCLYEISYDDLDGQDISDEDIKRKCDELQTNPDVPRCWSIPRVMRYNYAITNQNTLKIRNGLISYNNIKNSSDIEAKIIDNYDHGFICNNSLLFDLHKDCLIGTLILDEDQTSGGFISTKEIPYNSIKFVIYTN